MKRKRLTQRFPFLIPLRKKQRKIWFHQKMKWDKNKYANRYRSTYLPVTLFEAESKIINENSGFDIKYQYNKAHNLKLAAQTMDTLLILPGEVYSFYFCEKKTKHLGTYQEGLNLVDGKIVYSYGGGLCQLSNMIFWLLLHTPMTILERHGHEVAYFHAPIEGIPIGADATISEGWLDLKFKNETSQAFQLKIYFEEGMMKGAVLSDEKPKKTYEILNQTVRYVQKGSDIIEEASVDRRTRDIETGEQSLDRLYVNKTCIKYPLPAHTDVEKEALS